VGDRISAKISGQTGGDVIVGKGIVVQKWGSASQVVGADGVDALRREFEALRQQVQREAPPELQAEALERVAALEQATIGGQPDPGTMSKVRNWFQANLPKLAGGVVSLVIHPLVGKLVEAAGQVIADQFEAHFGT
jgi:hypothetical protein